VKKKGERRESEKKKRSKGSCKKREGKKETSVIGPKVATESVSKIKVKYAREPKGLGEKKKNHKMNMTPGLV